MKFVQNLVQKETVVYSLDQTEYPRGGDYLLLRTCEKQNTIGYKQ